MSRHADTSCLMSHAVELGSRLGYRLWETGETSDACFIVTVTGKKKQITRAGLVMCNALGHKELTLFVPLVKAGKEGSCLRTPREDLCVLPR